VLPCLAKQSSYKTAGPVALLQRVSIACYAQGCRILAMIDSVRPTVCPSVTRWYHVKTTQDTIMRSSLQDSPMTLSFLTVNFSAKFQRERREQGCRMREE